MRNLLFKFGVPSLALVGAMSSSAGSAGAQQRTIGNRAHPPQRQHATARRGDPEPAYLFARVVTYRTGRTQTAEATVSVRLVSRPSENYGVETLSCQITKPVTGERIEGRRVSETTCRASWPIAAETSAAMQDFEVSATASAQFIGNLSEALTFRYAEM